MGTSSSVLQFSQAFTSLTTAPVGLDNHATWKPIFATVVNPGDIMYNVDPITIRRLRKFLPQNLAGLIFKCVEQLCLFLNSPRPNDSQPVKNALGILTRMLPFAFEPLIPEQTEQTDVEVSPFAEKFAFHVFQENLLCDEDNSKFPLTENLGELLMKTLVATGFVPGFTLNEAAEPLRPSAEHPYIEPGYLWSACIGHDPQVSFGYTSDMLIQRQAVVQGLISALTSQLYNEDPCALDPLRRFLCDVRKCPHGSTLVCSLLNFIVNYNPSGVAPYTSHFNTGKEDFVYRAVQLLNILLDFDSFVAEDGAVDVVPLEFHAAWSLFQQCSRKECEQIILGLGHLITNETKAKSTYFPASQRALSYYDEFVIFLWKLLEKVPNFLEEFCSSPLARQYIIPLLDFGLSARTEAGKFANMQLLAFILMRLSTVRDFVLLCNEPCSEYIPFPLQSFEGTYNDVIILGLLSVMATRKEWLEPVTDYCAVIIGNLSPYLTSVAQATGIRLVQYLVLASQEQWLRGGAQRPHILMCIVETFANLIQYQFTASAHAIYALLRVKNDVHNLYQGCQERKLPIPENILEKMHTGTLLCCLDSLKPQVTREAERNPNAEIVPFLRKTTLVGDLPVPHHIMIRRLEARKEMMAWVTSWMWGCIFMHTSPQIADAKRIKLFEMKKI